MRSIRWRSTAVARRIASIRLNTVESSHWLERGHAVNDIPTLLPLISLARHLDVPEYLLRDLPPAQRAAPASEALYDPAAAKAYLRQRGVIFVNGEPILIR